MGISVESTVWLFSPLFPVRFGVWKCWFLWREENRSTRKKTSGSREKNQQQTQPTYDAETGFRTRATLVGGECSHHYAIPAPEVTREVVFKLLSYILLNTSFRRVQRKSLSASVVIADCLIKATIFTPKEIKMT